ncbi:MAG: hypothetical protein ACD_5C00317G0001, partial [uncultured bacterium]
ASPFDKEEAWNRPQVGIAPKTKRNIIISASIVAVLILASAGIWGMKWWQKNAFHQDRVSIYFEGPKEADSTQPSKYLIHYKNDNRVTLRNAEIILSYAENFQPNDNVNLKYLSPTSSRIFIGDVKSMSEGTIELKGIFYAPKDFPVYLHAEINFTPSNGAAQLSMKNQIGVNITAAPVLLSIVAPQNAANGDSVTYVIDYKNLDIRQLTNVQIKAEFPEGFTPKVMEPSPSEGDSIWYLGNLEANQGGKITVQGRIKGNAGDTKDLIVSLGHKGKDDGLVVYSKQELSTHIVSPVLTIKQSLDGKMDDIVSAGETLKYVIEFENTGSIGLRDAIVTAKIDGKILDFARLNVDRGSFDGSNNTITWKASDYPALAVINPKAKGQLKFSVPIQPIIPVLNSSDKNYVVTSMAKIDSPDIPTPVNANKVIGSNQTELRLASKVLFNVKGFYNDSIIKNTGPMPMNSGQETTFTLHWLVSSVSNDITEARVQSFLPTGVRWTGQVFPADEKISYNQRTNQIIWDAGNIGAGTGVLSKPREVAFQVAITPQTNQIGQPIMLLNKSIFTAKDTFVQKEISLENGAKDTQLYEDQTIGAINGKVEK